MKNCIMHNVFPFSILCNDNATLLSTEISSFKCVCCLCKHGPKFSQRICNVIWDIYVLYLNIFLVKEPNNILSIKPNYMWKAHSTHFLIFITSKQMFKINAFSSFSFWKPTLTYQAHVVPSCTNTNTWLSAQESFPSSCLRWSYLLNF